VKIRLFGKQIEIRAQTLGSIPALQDDSGWSAFLWAAGYSVTHDSALKIAVVIRCADVVAKTMASLGCHLYKETDNGKIRATTKPLYKLLRYLPNPDTTAYEFWHMYIFNLMLTRGAYAKIVRDQNGFVKELWNIPSKWVRHETNKQTGEKYIIVYHLDGSTERIYDGNYMYTPGLRFNNPDKSEDFINIAADVLGLTMALNNFAKDFFENGSNLGGFVEYPSAIDRDRFGAFRKDWEKAYAGVANQHKWALLEGGFKLTKFDTKPEEAQALESRKFAIIEVCRIMGVTPHKVFQLEGVNYNSIEQLNIEFWQETIDPMDERLTLTIYRDLLSPAERENYFARFNTNKLLKGDTKARTDYYNVMRQGGVFSANTILDLEDMNLIPEEDGGDERLVNGNMIPLRYAKENLPKSLQKGVVKK